MLRAALLLVAAAVWPVYDPFSLEAALRSGAAVLHVTAAAPATVQARRRAIAGVHLLERDLGIRTQGSPQWESLRGAVGVTFALAAPAAKRDLRAPGTSVLVQGLGTIRAADNRVVLHETIGGKSAPGAKFPGPATAAALDPAVAAIRRAVPRSDTRSTVDAKNRTAELAVSIAHPTSAEIDAIQRALLVAIAARQWTLTATQSDMLANCNALESSAVAAAVANLRAHVAAQYHAGRPPQLRDVALDPLQILRGACGNAPAPPPAAVGAPVVQAQITLTAAYAL